jgi:hypothetical protein
VAGLKIDFAWRDGKLSGATLRSSRGGPCEVRYRDAVVQLTTEADQSYELANRFTRK